jgi:hypothetical protein
MSDLKQGVVSYFDYNIKNLIPSSERNLKEVHDIIKSPLLVEPTKACRKAATKEALKTAKNQLPSISPCGSFSKRHEDGLISTSGFLAIEIENINLDEINEIKKRILSFALIPTALIFTSPSGKGINWIVPMPKNFKGTRNAHKAISSLIKKSLNYEVNPMGGSLIGTCHLCHDPTALFNLNAQPYSYTLPSQDFNLPAQEEASLNNNSEEELNSSETLKEVEFLVRQFEASGKQLFDDNQDWRTLGFTLASILREEGRPLFHRLSSLSPKHEYNQINSQFDEALKNDGGVHTIGTIFHLAAGVGIELVPFKPKAKAELPHFPTELNVLLPESFRKILKPEKRTDIKDALLIGALTALSPAFNNISGLYNESRIQPALFSLILGPPASGKGKLAALKNLVMPIHNEWKQDYHKELEQYLEEKQNNPKLEITPPVRKLLLIPANNSSAGLISLLDRNEGVGLIFETEADTLIEALKKDYGSFSDLIRKGFHHESYDYYRKTDQEYCDLANPCFSILLTGTFDQLKKLIPKEDNGTFSRYLYYFLTQRESFKNPFANSEFDRNEYIENIGLTIHDSICQLKNNDYTFHLTSEQGIDYSNFFLSIETSYSNTDSMFSVIKRHALIGFRMMMVFSFLEKVENSSNEAIDEKLICTDKAFKAVKLMLPVLLKHASYALNLTSGNTEGNLLSQQKNENIQMLLQYLPQKFSRKQYLEVAKILDISKSTADRYIDNNSFGGKIKRLEKGMYEKMV